MVNQTGWLQGPYNCIILEVQEASEYLSACVSLLFSNVTAGHDHAVAQQSRLLDGVVQQ